MDVITYQLLHVAAVILLAAFAFQALGAADPANRKRTGVLTGVIALVALVAGFGLHAKLHHGFPLWMIVKIAAWVVLASIAGLAYRMPSLRGPLALLGTAAVVAAVWAVYFRPGA